MGNIINLVDIHKALEHIKTSIDGAVRVSFVMDRWSSDMYIQVDWEDDFHVRDDISGCPGIGMLPSSIADYIEWANQQKKQAGERN